MAFDIPNSPDAQCIPAARSAFGKYGSGPGIRNVDCYQSGSRYHFFESRFSNPKRSLQSFFGASRAARFDMIDVDDVGLFDRVFARIGSLQPDEVYGFIPGIHYGGSVTPETVSIFPIDAHLVKLREASGGTWQSVRGIADNSCVNPPISDGIRSLERMLAGGVRGHDSKGSSR